MADEQAKAEMVQHLVDRGVDQAEAEHLVASKDVAVVGVQLPAEPAPEIIQKLIKVGIITGPVRFFLCVAKDRQDHVAEIMTATSGKEITREWDFSMADIPGKNAVEAMANRISRGFSGMNEGPPDPKTN